MAFEAKYRGFCTNECGNPIEVGDLIAYTEDGELEHAGCFQKDNRPPNICDSCHLSKPCDCEDK